MIKDTELIHSQKVSLNRISQSELDKETGLLSSGMIVLCREGHTIINVNYRSWTLRPGAVIVLFPNDLTKFADTSEDFVADVLSYDPALLREASLQLEQTVYYQLRESRCRVELPAITDIVDRMFALLTVYFEQEDCSCLEQLVLLQLKAFFVGFHEYMNRIKSAEEHTENCSRRVREMFNMFIMLIEEKYIEQRDVSTYANMMNITPKYLNTIARTVTGHNAKTIIDHFVILQLKTELRHSTMSVKEIAWKYHFSDLSFFCRYFKQHTGMTPQTYRKT